MSKALIFSYYNDDFEAFSYESKESIAYWLRQREYKLNDIETIYIAVESKEGLAMLTEIQKERFERMQEEDDAAQRRLYESLKEKFEPK